MQEPVAWTESEIALATHGKQSAVLSVREQLNSVFSETAEATYQDVETDRYREMVHECQKALNAHGVVDAIMAEIYGDLCRYAGEERILVQSNLYLRATRPHVAQETESIGWHRETFYGPNMERAINVWTPIQGVDASNTLQFIPGSQVVPDDAIVTRQFGDPITTKGSTGNNIGFLYAPKQIVGGIDLSRAAPLNVPYFQSALFPGNLIHGSAVNRSRQVRFSVDFRVIPKRFYDKALSKQVHAASGRPYFEEYVPRVS